jgi:hypothetical protein
LKHIEDNGAGVLYRGGDGYSEVIYPGEEGLTAEIMTRSEKGYTLLPLEKYLLLGTEKFDLKYSLLFILHVLSH